MLKFRSIASAAALAGLFSAVGQLSAQAQTTFDTTYAWNGSNAIGSFGNPNTATYGETFVAPSDSVLDDFTFYVKPNSGASLSAKAFVYAWTGSLFGGGGGQATGPALYSSPASIIINNSAVFNPVTVNTGGITLTPGADYVAFLTVSDPLDFSATSGTSIWGRVNSHVAGDGGGGFVFYNNGNNPALLNTTRWDNFADFGDLAYTAHFHTSAVPEPGAMSLLAGLAVTGGAFVIRRRSTRKK